MSRRCFCGLGTGSVALEGEFGPCKDRSLLHLWLVCSAWRAMRHRLLASSRSTPCYGSRTLCRVGVCMSSNRRPIGCHCTRLWRVFIGVRRCTENTTWSACFAPMGPGSAMLPHCSTLESGPITAPGSFRLTLYGVTRVAGAWRHIAS